MKRKSSIWSLLKSFLFAIILVFIIDTWLFKPVQVVGSSMHPTLKDGQQGFSSILHLSLGQIDRFDVVVVKADEDFLVKRVIGLPNETIEYKDDQLFVNGVLVQETFLNQEYVSQMTQNKSDFTHDFGPVLVPDGHYFLMGDNRPVSVDSRFSQYGPFKKEDIISKNMLVLFPINEVKWVEH